MLREQSRRSGGSVSTRAPRPAACVHRCAERQSPAWRADLHETCRRLASRHAYPARLPAPSIAAAATATHCCVRPIHRSPWRWPRASSAPNRRCANGSAGRAGAVSPPPRHAHGRTADRRLRAAASSARGSGPAVDATGAATRAAWRSRARGVGFAAAWGVTCRASPRWRCPASHRHAGCQRRAQPGLNTHAGGGTQRGGIQRGGRQFGGTQRGGMHRGGRHGGGGKQRGGMQRGGMQRGGRQFGGTQRGGMHRGGRQFGGKQRGGMHRGGRHGGGGKQRGGMHRGGRQGGRQGGAALTALAP